MQVDPVQEWQQLTEHYRQMSDDELRDLACDFADLTNIAQQALRQEMQSRRMGDPETMGAMTQANCAEPPASGSPQQSPGSPRTARESTPVLSDSVLGGLGRAPMIVPDGADDSDDTEASGPHEYTWKTVLCECETTEQARELSRALHEEGLDSWVQGSREFGLRYARVLVAADQLNRAQAIAARPIPEGLIDEEKSEIPEYEAPRCPRCRAEDPVLESVDPVNTWHCEQCGEEWNDATGGDSTESSPDSAGKG